MSPFPLIKSPIGPLSISNIVSVRQAVVPVTGSAPYLFVPFCWFIIDPL